MSILNSGIEFLESRGFNTTNIVETISAKVWWINDEKNSRNLFHSTDWITCLCLILLAVLLYGLWWMIYVPINWTRDLTDIGYHHVPELSNKKTPKIDAINRIRRLRKTGAKVPPPFPNGWFSIVESKDLLPGKALSIDCLGENFAVFRTDKGEVHVLDAYCPHLGANLAVGGLVKGDCIECPFHHWTFRGSDGACDSIPYSTGAIPKSAKVKKWISQELNGAVYVWYHAESEEPWELTGVKEIDSGEWIYHGRNEFLINCHIQDIPENGADVAHLSAVHGPNMLTGSDLRFSRTALVNFGMHSWDASWKHSEDSNTNHLATLTLKHSMKLFNFFEIAEMDVAAKQIGPGHVQLVMNTNLGTFVILQNVTPIEPLVQKATHRIYGPRGMGWFAKFLIWGESVMFERDIMVWNHKQFADNPLLMKEDRLIKSYRNWYGQFYSDNSTSFSMAKETLEW